ncbi:MAG TPA: alpha-glucuronidase family glycosyl hydrolase, partial [Vicinamibacteria bacterium]
MKRPLLIASGLLLALGAGASARAETGYDLWLRYVPVANAERLRDYRAAVTHVVVAGKSPTALAIRAELRVALRGLLGADVPFADDVRGPGALVVGTPATSAVLKALGRGDVLESLGDEGYLLRSARHGKSPITVVAGKTERAALYGTFALLRRIQQGEPISPLEVKARPRLARRLLNHWDNLDGSIERGYAGRSLWSWAELPGRVDPRVEDYARANASIGINGTVVNSVNAKAESLTGPYLEKTAALAAVFRAYGIRLYLSANFASPRLIGGLETADPLDPRVARFWREKADEIYRVIPDFGGFLVKANSEG